MKILEIIATLKTTQPKVFSRLDDAGAKKFALGLLAEVGRLVDSAKDGPVSIPKLGRFKIKEVPSKGDPTTKARRIVLIRAKEVAKPNKKKKV